MKETDIAWLAGLLEGEGCFRVARRNSVRSGGERSQLRVVLKMSDRDVVERAAGLMHGNTISERPPSLKEHHSTMHTVSLAGLAAERVMRLVRPYMGQRRGAKIDELLALTNLSHHPRPERKAA